MEEPGVTHNPYVTGLSIALGIYAFSWNGFVIGPLLVFLTLIAYDIFAEKYQKKDARRRARGKSR